AAPGTAVCVARVVARRGIGTVVTGTLWSGSLGEGDELRAEPAGLDVRVRSVQIHDEPVARAGPGRRVAASLPGIERSRLRRGDVLVAPGAYPVSYRLDVALDRLRLLESGDAASIVRASVRTPVRRADLAARALLSADELDEGLPAVERAGEWFFAAAWLEELRAAVHARLEERARRSPIDPGLPVGELVPT